MNINLIFCFPIAYMYFRTHTCVLTDDDDESYIFTILLFVDAMQIILLLAWSNVCIHFLGR
jgi:hypothetical protein